MLIFHDNFGNVFKVNYCEINKEINLLNANGTYNPRKFIKRDQHNAKK
jgi:hypothetical protein